MLIICCSLVDIVLVTLQFQKGDLSKRIGRIGVKEFFCPRFVGLSIGSLISANSVGNTNTAMSLQKQKAIC